jgi:HSP20 family protein
MERLLDRFVEPRWEEFDAGGEWQPRVDLSETKDAVVVKAEIPGVEQKDIQVTLQGEMLTIKGEKQQQKEEKDEHYHRVERSYGAFARSFRLPGTVDGAKVTAAFKDGVLTVTLPKAASAKGTTIPIKAA